MTQRVIFNFLKNIKKRKIFETSTVYK